MTRDGSLAESPPSRNYIRARI